MAGVDVKTPEKGPELVEDFEAEGSPEQGDLSGGGGEKSRSPEQRRSSGENEEAADCWRHVAERQTTGFGGQDEGGATNTVLLLDRANLPETIRRKRSRRCRRKKWLLEKRRRWPER
ncbi:site-specific DNA-methyltransferase [Sesbania bispinosa]|nr:site-specific DNA-methyltransferase [Sesbania bispinosa]